MKFLLILSLLISLNAFAQKQSGIYDYPLVKIVDGDTITFEAKFLPKPLKQELSLRIYGVDTPEKGFRAKCSKENDLGSLATKFTSNQVNKAKKRQVVIMEWDKYGGRVLGDILLDGKSLREMLIKNGYAREYYGEAKQSWC